MPYEKQVFLDAFPSPDLIHWAKYEIVLDTAAVTWAHKAMRAPSIIEKDNKYHIFFGVNDIQSGNDEGGIGVAVSNTPGGPYKVLLGKPLIDKFHNCAQPMISLFPTIRTVNIT